MLSEFTICLFEHGTLMKLCQRSI